MRCDDLGGRHPGNLQLKQVKGKNSTKATEYFQKEQLISRVICYQSPCALAWLREHFILSVDAYADAGENG